MKGKNCNTPNKIIKKKNQEQKEQIVYWKLAILRMSFSRKNNSAPEKRRLLWIWTREVNEAHKIIGDGEFQMQPCKFDGGEMNGPRRKENGVKN